MSRAFIMWSATRPSQVSLRMLKTADRFMDMRMCRCPRCQSRNLTRRRHIDFGRVTRMRCLVG